MKRTALAVMVVLMMLTAVSASANGQHKYTTTTSSTVPDDTTTTTEVDVETTTTTVAEETTTTVEETTTTTVPAPEGVCVDPNTAGMAQLMTVQGVDRSTALAIINTTSFDSPFQSVSELQQQFNLGNQVLEPVFPDWPGYFSDECLSEGFVGESTTTTEPEVEATATTLDPGDPADPSTPELVELPFTGVKEDLLLLGSSLLVLGALALWSARNREDAA